MEKLDWKAFWIEAVRMLILNIAGSFFYAAGITCFASPHKIAPGGASGIAIIVNYVTGWPIGVFVFLFNIPLLIWIAVKKYFSMVMILRIILSTALLSVITDYVVSRLPVYQGDPLLAAMFAGALMGIGLALVHMGKSNTGGISLLGLIINKIVPNIPIGSVIMFCNTLVVLASCFVYRNVESMLYATVTVYLSGMFMDKMVNQAEAKDLMLVMADTTDIVQRCLIENQARVTVLQGKGGYRGETQRVLLCAVDHKHSAELEKRIKTADRHAMVITAQVSSITGKGFGHIM